MQQRATARSHVPTGAGRRTITNEHELLEGLQRTHGAAEEARLRV